MRPLNAWQDLPHIKVLFHTSLGGEHNGAVWMEQREVINFILYPSRLFAVIRADPIAPATAVRAFGRIIRLHCGAIVVDSELEEDSYGITLPPKQFVGKGKQWTMRRWSIGAGVGAARLEILDDYRLPMAEVTFREWTTEGRLWLIASIVLEHRAGLSWPG